MSRIVYLDESGTHDGSPIMTMAGYVFKPIQADRFSREWEKERQRLGYPYAHQTDCATGNGGYAKLTMEQRIDAQKRLITHIKRRSEFGFSVTLDPAHYANEIAPHKGMPTAYSFLVLAAVNALALWAERREIVAEFSYIFEAGHENQHEANIIMQALATEPDEKRREYRYTAHRFLKKQDAPPLQAADFLAWQVFTYHKRKAVGHLRPRADFKAVIRRSDFNQDFTGKSIEAFRDELQGRMAAAAE